MKNRPQVFVAGRVLWMRVCPSEASVPVTNPTPERTRRATDTPYPTPSMPIRLRLVLSVGSARPVPRLPRPGQLEHEPDELRERKVTGNQVALRAFSKERFFTGTDLFGEGATCPESAAARRI